jgi:DNA helicase II / ATP-dependent DNA helicase PcrA
MADKRLILAVAGSGKTRHLIENLNLSERFLIITYTNTSLNLIKSRIIRKFGYHPINIQTKTYFEFVYGFCIKPYCLFKYKLKGIYWETPPKHTSYFPNTNLKKYLTERGFLYHNRLAKFVDYEGILEEIKKRLELFYDHFYFDEFQDLGGHDFNFVTQISQANINFLFVGDFFQHTYVTSFDGAVNRGLYADLIKYCGRLNASKIQIDQTTLGNSFRCSSTICAFVSDNIGISIASARKDTTEIIRVSNRDDALKVVQNPKIIKLVYNESSTRGFVSKNWGDCKGEDDYIDTCIVLNKTTAKIFSEKKFKELKPLTKNKLYVALTRTRGNCYLIDEALIK